MALVGRCDGRNFGYGRQLSYAGPQALKDMFGGGHYGTVKAHCDRWQAVVRWCRSEQGPGINDARQIDRNVLADYAAYLRSVVAPCGVCDISFRTEPRHGNQSAIQAVPWAQALLPVHLPTGFHRIFPLKIIDISSTWIDASQEKPE
ncbi:hypothetical protein ACVWZT_001085 [Pseudomonas sp. TE21394]